MERNENMIYVPLELHDYLVRADERMRILERITGAKTYININDLRVIIGADPIPETKTELSFKEMLGDDPGIDDTLPVPKSSQEGECT